MFPTPPQDLIERGLSLSSRAAAQRHQPGLGLVKDVRRVDLEYHGESEIGKGAGQLAGVLYQPLLRHRDAVGRQHLLRLMLAEGLLAASKRRLDHGYGLVVADGASVYASGGAHDAPPVMMHRLYLGCAG